MGGTMGNDSSSVDAKGIEIFSAEERNEINERIEAASVRDAVTAPGIPSRAEATKREFFPFLVNSLAALLLAAGVLLLFSSQKTDAAEIRDSGAILGVTERALIREIRREINLQLNEKDTAIDTMNRRIAEVDLELGRLNSLEALTDEQRDAMAVLMAKQEEYRESLAGLQQERAVILTQARIREAQARQREELLLEQQLFLEDISAQDRAEIEKAREELSRLSGEAEKTAFIEKQLAAFYSTITRQIEEKQYKAAEGSIAALKEYLATPSFASLKTIQARHDSDLAAVNALSLLLQEAQKTTGGAITVVQAEEPPPVPPGAGAEAALRQQTAAQSVSIAELQKALSDMQQQNDTAIQTVAERDRQIDGLRATNTAQAQTIETLQNTIAIIRSATENQQ